jgi:ribosomal protein L11 methyltransferase
VIRLSLRVRRSDAELALVELLELVPAGVEECDDGGEMVEYAIYGAPGELPQLPDLQATIGPVLVEVATSEVADDWQQRWKLFHRPVSLPSPAPEKVPGLRVRPPWEPAQDAAGAQEIVIDPGQAFGTGSHATTRLCLELLMELAATGWQGDLIDVGTGSGVLAIAAVKLGFENVLAFDSDRESVSAAGMNAKANAAEVTIERFDLRNGLPAPVARAVVVANLLRPLHLQLAASMSDAPAHLISGGLLLSEVEEVVQAFASRHRMRERERRQEGEWAAVWLADSGEDRS